MNGQFGLGQIQFDPSFSVDTQIKERLSKASVEFEEVQATGELAETDFVCAAYYKEDKVLIGCADGSVCAFDTARGTF
jgi:hypothetical protein